MAYSDSSTVYRITGLSSNEVSTDDIDLFIVEADAWIDAYTRKTYNSPSSYTDYFSVNESDWNIRPRDGGQLVSTVPFDISKDNFFLRHGRVTKISNVWGLNKSSTVNVYSYDSASGTYTDNSEEANSVSGTPFQMVSVEDDILYVGLPYKFLAITNVLFTLGTDGVIVTEYYNGSSWTTITVTEDTANAKHFLASGKLSWDLPKNWELTTINNLEAFWVRFRVTTDFTVKPTMTNAYLDYNTVISREFNHNEFTWNDKGKLLFRTFAFAPDMQVVRIDYFAGEDSVPTLIKELSGTIAGIKALVNRIGASFDDVTGSEVGDIRIQKGEQWTGFDQTIKQLKAKKKELLDHIGRGYSFYST